MGKVYCHVQYAIFVIIFYFQFAVVILTNIAFVCLSPFQILHVTISMLCRLSEFTLTEPLTNPDEALSDYFMIDHI